MRDFSITGSLTAFLITLLNAFERFPSFIHENYLSVEIIIILSSYEHMLIVSGATGNVFIDNENTVRNNGIVTNFLTNLSASLLL